MLGPFQHALDVDALELWGMIDSDIFALDASLGPIEEITEMEDGHSFISIKIDQAFRLQEAKNLNKRR